MMHRRLYLVSLGFALVGCAPNAKEIRGDGHLIEETRSVPAFTGVDVSDHLAAEVEIGGQAVDVNLDENLVSLVTTRVQGGLLEVANPDASTDLVPSPSARIRITNPSYDDLRASGEASIDGHSASAALSLQASGDSSIHLEIAVMDNVTAEASGAAHVALSGAAPRMTIAVSGEASFESSAPSDSADVDASGSAHVRVAAATTVKVRASGDSHVTIIGNPSVRDVETSGTAVVDFAPAGAP